MKSLIKYTVVGAIFFAIPAFADMEHRTIIDGRSVKTTDGSPLVIYPSRKITADDCFIGPLTVANSQGEIALSVPDGTRVPDGCDPR